WTGNNLVWYYLETCNDFNGNYSTDVRGNESWGYDISSRPCVSKTKYAVVVTKDGSVNIANFRHSSASTYYTNADESLLISPSSTITEHQRPAYTFTKAYNHSKGEGTTTGSGNIISNNNYTASMHSNGKDWILYARVNGNVKVNILDVPYPKEHVVNFNQWESKVVFDWKSDNPNSLTGKFYVYRRETTPPDASWTNLTASGIAVENGSNKPMKYENTLTTTDFNKNFEYCIAFIEGTGTAPTNPITSVRAADRIERIVNTTPVLNNWTATAIGNPSNITVSFTADNRLDNKYTFTIERLENEIPVANFITSESFSGASTYTRADNWPQSPCDAYKYTVKINAFGTVFSKETGEVRITGSTKFLGDKPAKASKGEYANYVRLQWKMDKGGPGNEVYRVFRRVANTNQPFVELETVTSNAATVYWSDYNALTGIYYEYKITHYQICGSEETESASFYDIGFTQAFGTVSGRVTYGTGSSVQGVNMLVRKNELNQDETQFLSLKADGGGQKIEWNAAEASYFNDIYLSKQWTLQFWLKLSSQNSSGVIGYFGNNPITIDKQDNYYRVGFQLNGQWQYTGYEIPTNHFSHVTIACNANEIKLYVVCDYDFNNIYYDITSAATPELTALLQTECNISFGHSLYGNIDDVRFWKRCLGEPEIKRDYSRRLVGNENGLTAYWTFDEGLAGYAFDMSRVGTVYNGNHATTNTLVFDNSIPNDEYQLALKAITDANGNYQISGIPYIGEGTSYSIVPLLGVHQFNPTEQLRYISPASMVHNNTDFTDISAFEVKGTVVYENGSYPVEGCNFEVDGKIVVRPNGQPVTSDFSGNFTINVPIGIHAVRVVKLGHTFTDDGFIKQKKVDPQTLDTIYVDLNYNAPINNLLLEDQTLVKLVGRVVGGMIENDKPLGFGESKNNIGTQTIKLESTRNVNLKFVENTYQKTYNHNNGEWKKPGGIGSDQTTVYYNPNDITIHVSPQTGEFVAWVYPEPYNIAEIRVPTEYGTMAVYDNRELLDLKNAVAPDISYLKTSARTWADSVFIAGKPGVVDHWEYFENSDTVWYNEQWTYFYQATPTFTALQTVNNEPVNYFGELEYILNNELTGDTDTLTLYNSGAGYLFGKPVFKQGKDYTFHFKAYEEYINYVLNDSMRYPVKDGSINLMNEIQLTPEPELIKMDDNGELDYIFTAGTPNLTTGSNTFFATLRLGTVSYYWNMPADLVSNNTSPIEVWHLGDKSTGTDFVTCGPDQITLILRDPPGTSSSSFIEKGTTVSTTHSYSYAGGVNLMAQLNLSLGTSITSFVGLGAGVITKGKAKLDFSAGIKTEFKYTADWKTAQTASFLERIETSDSPDYVGYKGDIFIGNSTNILYGLTNGISIEKNSTNITNAFETVDINSNLSYSIVPSQALAFGQDFDTRFVFTTLDIEDIMIPKWEKNRSMIFSAYVPIEENVYDFVDTTAITKPTYVSRLLPTDINFGKVNMDTVFGDKASDNYHYHDGPSYIIVFPQNYDYKLFVQDSVIYYNNQINVWINVLTQNEKEKVKMKKLGNYSFGGGSTTSYSFTGTASETFSQSFYTKISIYEGIQTGVKINDCGFEIILNGEVVGENSVNDERLEETVISTGFTLKEEGTTDQLTVDYGITASGTFAFKTRGGRTSCPYEAQVLTKYFEPGMHILSEGTMQIEVPKIRVESAPIVLNVPANKTATFLLALENESETNEDIWFEFIVDEATNPHGAVLK
ncbi:MAG: LamG domain-containing protein, partial [Bacteroidales bacterium]|nr:LamG domain-containing protein [Bacteroidales bacterium]